MHFRILGVLSISAALAMPAAAQSPDSVHYAVAPVMEGGALTGLAVEIRFTGDEDGETGLLLPREWAGSDSLWRHLEEIEVRGATSVRTDVPESRVIAHAPGAPLVVRYRVRSPYAGDPGFGYHKAWPLVRPDWFFFHGEGVFAAPQERMEAPARLAWGAFPEGWKVVSDLDHLRTGARPGTVTDVVESAAIGAPDLAVVERTVDGAPLRVGMRGAWDFSPDAFADAVAAVVNAENRLWGDPGRPFVVTLTPLGGEGPGLSYTGTNRGDAFSVASTPGFALGEAARFLAHEYMHTWIARDLGGFPAADEISMYWFSEGFTDFYAPRALLRAGLWTPADFAAELNATLLRNASSPVRLATAPEVSARFWTDPDVQKLPYDRGHLLAALLDYRVRRASAGRMDMDDVMQETRALARRRVNAPTPADASELFTVTLMNRFGVDPLGALALHLDGGEPVVLPADLYGACATVRTIEQPVFTRGFDPAATSRAGNVVAGVDPAGPAYAAGLRDGMRLLRRESGAIGDASVELAYRVDDGGTERVIRYLPHGTGTVTFQRVELSPEATSPACVALMGGG
jgi:predicted metalloprotease with PDZ domain